MKSWAIHRSARSTINWAPVGKKVRALSRRRVGKVMVVVERGRRALPVARSSVSTAQASAISSNSSLVGVGVELMRGNDIEGDILVTLDEAMRGAVRTISLQRTNPRTGQTETHSFKVRIPAGVQEGQIIRVPGKGGEGASGGASGDLYLRVRFAAHPDFQVRGVNLYYDLDIAPWEGVLGTTVRVPTLDGGVSVRIPPGTNNGQQFRVPLRGLPKGRNGERGDLFVVVNVQLPQRISEEERKLWEQLSKVSRFNPRASG